MARDRRDGRVLTAKQLDNLKLYKYCGVDRSYLTRYVLNPFWTWLVTLFPLWMAPNLITLIGLLFMISATSLVFLYHSDPPSYLNMDAIDGKQARRTGTSSPLGELFDHGCDAINMLLMTILIPFICGIPLGPSNALIALFGFAAFLGSTWEEWHTGILYLGIVSGPTEGAWSLCLVSLISGIYGSSEIWSLPRQIPYLGSIPLNYIVLYTFLIGAASAIRTSSLHVWRKSGFKALRHLIWPFAYFYTCWLVTLTIPEIYKEASNFYWFVFFAGFPTCFRVSKTIVSYVTKSSLPAPTVLELFPSILLVLNYFKVDNLPVMKLLTLASGAVYMIAVHLIVFDLCAYLNINCLTIKRNKTQ